MAYLRCGGVRGRVRGASRGFREAGEAGGRGGAGTAEDRRRRPCSSEPENEGFAVETNAA